MSLIFRNNSLSSIVSSIENKTPLILEFQFCWEC